MKEIVRTTCEIFWLTLILVASIAGEYWVLRTYLGLSREGAILLLSPTALLLGLASIYAYYLGWERRRIGQRGLPARVVFRCVFQLLLFSGLVLTLGLLIVYFASRNDVLSALIISVTGILISFWGLRRIQREMDRLKIEEGRPETGDGTSWPTFERGFRIIVLLLLLALPLGLSLFFLVFFRDTPVAILFAVIAAIVGSWVIRKLRVELRR